MAYKTISGVMVLSLSLAVLSTNAHSKEYIVDLQTGVHKQVEACRHTIGDGSSPQFLENGTWHDYGGQGVCDSYSVAPANVDGGKNIGNPRLNTISKSRALSSTPTFSKKCPPNTSLTKDGTCLAGKNFSIRSLQARPRQK